MKIVIEIPEDSYKATCVGCMLPSDVENVVQAIKNGTPLERHRNITNEEMYQQLTHLEAENERLHDALEAQPTSDDEIIKALKAVRTIHNGNYAPQIDEAIRRLEAQPSDAVSRQDVDAYIAKLMSGYLYDEERTRLEEFSAYLWELPSVTPERPKGKWIEVEVHNCHATLKCSVCNRVIEPTFTFGEYSYEDIKTFYPYCHCGAEMEV